MKDDSVVFTPDTPTPTYQAKYISTHKRAQIVRLLLTVGIVLSVFSLLFSVVQYAFPELINFEEEETPGLLTIAIALLVMGLAVLEIGVYIATIVFFLMWLYRSYENLPAFGVRRGDIEYSSGWAVGSFFVPIVLLIIPYRAVRELWRKSVPNQSNMFREMSPPAFFPLWWAAWLISGVVGQIYFRAMFQELTPDVELALGVASSVLSILAAVFAIMVVSEIDKQQTESSKLLSHQVISQTPPPPDVAWNEVAQPQTGL